MNNENNEPKASPDFFRLRALDLEMRYKKSENRLTFYMWLAFTGWVGVIVLLLQAVMP